VPTHRPGAKGLTVAVTGPTGEIGCAAMRALERCDEVAEIRGMARRPCDPALDWKKLDYRQGDVLHPGDCAKLVRGADVVVHLAFIIMGDDRQTAAVNLQGSQNVFEAARDAGVPRLVYTSSVAAYGFHADNPQPLTEDVPVRGSEDHYYSAQKAEVERLLAETLQGSDTAAWVLRPCIVAGPDAQLLVDSLPYTQLSERLPAAVMRLLDDVPILKPVLPDPGVPFQLVHHDDVATAIRAAVLGRGAPGAYNIAGAGQITARQLADELGWYSIPVPELAVDVVAEIVERIGILPTQAQWIAAFREPVIMDVHKARQELRWRPRHSALQTLHETVTAARMHSIVR
jgi:nucleoside-diphosphate-sugar epimerase